ncbi:hypothetical protein GN958_ATG05556 [Phytophthora infestans]|uniref:Uncharacterized protein n=1 Tax=Phytophthora infestans TaxID=4787 RepID=A0A8S9V1C5_PHYIN|nr:hypothetical protein GN958_ATG05556 [Phytophthora infestans]
MSVDLSFGSSLDSYDVCIAIPIGIDRNVPGSVHHNSNKLSNPNNSRNNKQGNKGSSVYIVHELAVIICDEPHQRCSTSTQPANGVNGNGANVSNGTGGNVTALTSSKRALVSKGKSTGERCASYDGRQSPHGRNLQQILVAIHRRRVHDPDDTQLLCSAQVRELRGLQHKKKL